MLPEHGLGRKFAPDARDAKFPLRAGLTKKVPKRLPKYRYWTTGPVLDQGSTSQCVGYAWRQWMRSSPLTTKGGPDPATIYVEAQKVDEWEGEDYDGTSVRAGAKVLTQRGHVKQYLWAQDLQMLKEYVLLEGTVVMGTLWYEGMERPDSRGFVKPNGEIAGGHAYLCIGYNTTRKAFRFVNSWGLGWGQKGRFWMHEDDVAVLLANQGEACAATEQVVLPQTATP